MTARRLRQPGRRARERTTGRASDHLLFSYEGGGGSRQHTDGTVSIESQLPATLQAQAAGMRGFHADHDSILADDGAVAEVQRILDLK